MAGGIVKATLALGAIAAIGAGVALTGAGAIPSVDPKRPTVGHGPTVTPAVFRHSVRSLPQLGTAGKHELQKPRAWEGRPRAFVPEDAAVGRRPDCRPGG